MDKFCVRDKYWVGEKARGLLKLIFKKIFFIFKTYFIKPNTCNFVRPSFVIFLAKPLFHHCKTSGISGQRPEVAHFFGRMRKPIYLRQGSVGGTKPNRRPMEEDLGL